MNDWADEIADGLCANGEYIGQTKAVAKALRKAKANGIREIAPHFWGAIPPRLMEIADTIEKGETTIAEIFTPTDYQYPPQPKP